MIDRLRFQRLIGVVLAVVLLWPEVSFAAGRVIYVRSSSAGGDGQSWATAFASLQPAIDAANVGDELWVAAGDYVPALESFYPAYNASVLIKDGIALYGGFAGTETLRAQRNPKVNLTKLYNYRLTAWATAIPLIQDLPTTISGFVIYGSSFNRYGLTLGSVIEGTPHAPGNLVTISDNQFQTGSVIGDNVNALIQGNTFTSGAGIELSGAPRILSNQVDGGGGSIWVKNAPSSAPTVIANNLTQGWIRVDNSNALIVNNTIVGVRDKAPIILVSGTVTFENNILAYNAHGNGYIGSAVLAIRRNNLIFGNTPDSVWGGLVPFAEEFQQDPLFLSYELSDWHLRSNSPAVNSGDDGVTQANWVDADGLQRKFGAHVDVGAFEYGSQSGTPPLPPSGTATFDKLDTATQGTWKGTYGADGYAINSDVTSYPSYAQVAITNNLNYVWNPGTADGRALQKGNGSDRIASTWYATTGFSINVNLTDGATHRVALYAVDWDLNNTRTQIVEVRDTAGTLLDSRNLSTFSNGQYLVWNLKGHVQINVINSGPNAVISGIFFGPGGTVAPPSSGSATFIALDTATRGSWKGTYGSEGYRIHSDVTSDPAYAQVAISGNRDYVWNPSTQDPRALQKGNGSDRIASTWYTEGTYTIDVNLTDGAAHQVAFYAVDWDDYARTQTVEVRDVNGALLDSRNVSAFGNGKYLVWSLRGHVQIKVINTGSNAVISGIFFGPGGVVPPPPSADSATFIKLDTTTQGTWKGVYGTDGYAIHSDATNYPGYAQVAVSNALDYVWAPSTSDLRALQKSNAPGRIASTWYTAGTATIELNLTDGAAHQVAVYAVDWDLNNTRTQTIEVRDMTGTLLDSRTLSAFGNGQYLVWTLRGHVRITVRNAGFNAVISGIFFGV